MSCAPGKPKKAAASSLQPCRSALADVYERLVSGRKVVERAYNPKRMSVEGGSSKMLYPKFSHLLGCGAPPRWTGVTPRKLRQGQQQIRATCETHAGGHQHLHQDSDVTPIAQQRQTSVGKGGTGALLTERHF